MCTSKFNAEGNPTVAWYPLQGGIYIHNHFFHWNQFKLWAVNLAYRSSKINI